MWRSADLYLRAHEHARHQSGKYDLVDGIIPTLDSVVRYRPYDLDRHTLIPSIGDMISLRDSPHQEAPLRLEKSRIESSVIAIGRQVQHINIRLGEREIVIVAGFIDEGKYAIGDTNVIEDEKQTTGLEQDPFHVCFAAQPFSPAGEIEQSRYILGTEAAHDKLSVERGLDSLFRPPERGVFMLLGHHVA